MPFKGMKSHAPEGCWLCPLHPTHEFSISRAKEGQGSVGGRGTQTCRKGPAPGAEACIVLPEPGRDLRGNLWGLCRVENSSVGSRVQIGGKGLGKTSHTTSERLKDQVALFTQSSSSWGDTLDNSPTWRTDRDHQGPDSTAERRDDTEVGSR